ncbi:hypothetical protein [Blastopirellula marina]|uniref:Tetratricopeptide repeat protein n=1 Tax=Blastopirellula marina TaxID=124 RepID=A0A2S8FLE7_9BACT|nr:hypothetical protein [Blastopirellula marina]PQO32981.1 hypothetical protein C5Y98_17745 [Blastopirellula marina]PTL43148.1 hypothetical protein C5Y97_17755 [Blastopirellula marina]
MPIPTKFTNTLSTILLLAPLGLAHGEPIRLMLDEMDRPLQEQAVAPAKSVKPAEPTVRRPFSLSLLADDEPIAPNTSSKVRLVSGEMPPTPDQKLEVQVLTPAANPNQLPAANGPLRVRQIHEEAVPNPAAPAGTPPFREEPLRATIITDEDEPASAPLALPEPPGSRYSVASQPTTAPPTTTQPQPWTASAPPEVAAPVDDGRLTVRNLMPGKTPLARLDEAWGEPAKQRRIDQEKRVRLYENQPGFAQVEVALDGEKIVSLLLIPAQPMTLDEVEDQFALRQIAPADVRDATGRSLGWIYPEKGIMLPQPAETNSSKIDRILVQALSPEGYLIRARGRSPLAYRDRLEDYRLALELEPHSAEAWYETSKILEEIGRKDEAFEASRHAISGIGAQPEYRLHRSRLSATLGNLNSAIQSTKQIAEDANVAAQVRAAAYCQWGDLLQMAGTVKNQEAVTRHVKAIETASPLVNDPDRNVRRAAKQVLIDAHLSLALDIATGDWEKKPETVNQWLSRAKIYVDDVVTNEEGTDLLRLSLLTHSLQAHSSFAHNFDPGESVDQIVGRYRELVRQTDDPFLHRAIEWKAGLALSKAALVENDRGRYLEAVELADQARTYVKAGLVGRDVTVEEHLLLGNVFFRAGTIQAVQKQNHHAAADWYDRAIPHLTDPKLKAILQDERGEALVSMGVSYWSIGHRQQGVELSEQGKSLIESASTQNPALRQKLIVPLDNLAQMYRQLGDTQRSAEYTASSQELQQSFSAGPVQR